MKLQLLEFLVCSDCNRSLDLSGNTCREGEELVKGTLTCRGCKRCFPVLKGVPRFVPDTNYADSFGLQWNRFATTQQDSLNRTEIFRGRWNRIIGEGPEVTKGKVVLDAGCGAGPFIELISDYAQEILAVDLSSAVDACYELHGKKSNVHVIQGDLFHLPLRDGIADLIYAIGVLQHTPDPLRAFMGILSKAKPGGMVIIWNYPYRWWRWLTPRAWWRMWVSRLSPRTTYDFIRIYTPIALGLRRLARKVPVVGRKLQKIIFVCDYEEIYPELSEVQLYEWALLDTYDSLATRYENCLPDEAYIEIATKSGFTLYSRGIDGKGPVLRFQRN